MTAEVSHAIICVGFNLLLLCRWIHFQTVEEAISAVDVWGRTHSLPRRCFSTWPAGAVAEQLWGHRGRQGDLGPAEVAFRWMQRLLLRSDPRPEQIPAAAYWNLFRVQVTGLVTSKWKLKSYHLHDGEEGGKYWWWISRLKTNFDHMSPLVFTFWCTGVIPFYSIGNRTSSTHSNNTCTDEPLCLVFSQWLNMLRKVKNVSNYDTIYHTYTLVVFVSYSPEAQNSFISLRVSHHP